MQTLRTQMQALKNFADAPPPVERCELCSTPLADVHQHLVDPQDRRLICTCDACAMLFMEDGSTRLRRVLRDVWSFDDFQLDAERWDTMQIPIGLAFFMPSSTSDEILTVYPSPAGPTESSISADVWRQVVTDNPALERMRPDIEALLINRVRGASDHFITPIDQCYGLVGMIRTNWQGFSGGQQAWQAIGEYFDRMRRRARPMTVTSKGMTR